MSGYDTSFVKGRKTGLYVYLITDGVRTVPSDVTVTLAAPVTADDTDLTVVALSVAIPQYTKLTFDNGGSPVTVQVAALAAAAATSITIDAAPADIDDASEATWDQLVRVQGGTSSSMQLNSNTTQLQSSPYEGSEAATWDDAETTSQSWQIPWQGNFKPDDPGYKLVQRAAFENKELYVKYEAPREDTSIARREEGFVGVQNYQRDQPSDNIVTASWTFIGKGAPTVTDVAAA